MDDFLNIQVGSQLRAVTVKDIKKDNVTMKDGRQSDKVSFTVYDANNDRTFTTSDTWIQSGDGSYKIQGLWFTAGSAISPGSSVAKLLRFYNVTSLGELIGKEVLVYPDHRDFLVLTACDIPKDLIAAPNVNAVDNTSSEKPSVAAPTKPLFN